MKEARCFVKKKLCYGCCKPINDRRNSKTCKKRRKCKHCEGTHPTVLHGYKIKLKERSKQGQDSKENAEGENRSTSVNCTSSRMNQVISICVVPVKVRINRSQGVVTTWAMLDNCSQGSFVKTNLLEELRVSGIKTSVTIKTLNGDYKHSTIAVDGLEVTNVDEKKGEGIKLPRVFSQDDLPAASDEIATADNIKKWEYLHKIIPKMKNFDGQDFQLLIGANCLRALEPLEVITSEGDGPYAFRSRLGWCVVGPLSERRDENRFHCNRILVKDCSTGRVSGHQFTVNSCKEDVIGDLLKKLYTTDFTEKPIILGNGINVKLSKVSEEDMSFLKIMNQGCSRIGDHYVLPLPFRDTSCKLTKQ